MQEQALNVSFKQKTTENRQSDFIEQAFSPEKIPIEIDKPHINHYRSTSKDFGSEKGH